MPPAPYPYSRTMGPGREFLGYECQISDVHNPVVVDIRSRLESQLVALFAERAFGDCQVRAIDLAVSIHIAGEQRDGRRWVGGWRDILYIANLVARHAVETVRFASPTGEGGRWSCCLIDERYIRTAA